MGSIIHAVLRAIAFLWALLLMALLGNVIANNVNAAGSASKAVNFSMFVAVWAMVTVLFGLLASFITALALPLLLIPLEIFAVLFTLIDGIVLAAKLTSVNCGNIHNESSTWIAYGSHNNEKRCREIQASVVFMWFLFATFLGILFFTVKDSRGSMGSLRGRFSKSRTPNMAQVSA